jgi:hypothetical protein
LPYTRAFTLRSVQVVTELVLSFKPARASAFDSVAPRLVTPV